MEQTHIYTYDISVKPAATLTHPDSVQMTVECKVFGFGPKTYMLPIKGSVVEAVKQKVATIHKVVVHELFEPGVPEPADFLELSDTEFVIQFNHVFDLSKSQWPVLVLT